MLVKCTLDTFTILFYFRFYQINNFISSKKQLLDYSWKSFQIKTSDQEWKIDISD
jgi:hypothetical protein